MIHRTDWLQRIHRGTAQHWPAPDFMRPARGRPPLAWVLVLAALLGLLVAAVDAWQTHAQWRLAGRALSAAREPLARSNAAGNADGSGTEAAMAESGQRRQAQARQALAWPWAEVLTAAEAAAEAAAAPGITWLSLTHGTEGTLSLQGLAADADTALGAAQALDRALRAGADLQWGPVVLTDLQPDSALPGAPQRFALQAQARPQAQPR